MARTILTGLLGQLIDRGGSDLHLRAGRRPRVRVDGALQVLEHPPLRPSEIRALASFIPDGFAGERFKGGIEADAGFTFGGCRFRANLFTQLGVPGAVLRLIPRTVGALGEMGIPAAAEELCQCPHGLVLVTGPSGAGKTTTLAAMLQSINRRQPRHILTIEDPVEFVHNDHKCLVTHREVRTDTSSFESAIRMALREDPDVVLVGEMRDVETIEAVLRLAETGHLTLSTLHTNSACSTLNRIISCFGGNRQSQIRSQLSMVLQGVLCQQLVPRKDSPGRVLASEVLIPNAAIRHLIRENKVHQIYSIIQAGRRLGMQTMNQALAELHKAGHVGKEECFSRSPDIRELGQLLGTPGRGESSKAQWGES